MVKATQSKAYDFDAIIIGTGPGGEGAAMNLAKSGKTVAVIERHQQVGGGCTHWGHYSFQSFTSFGQPLY